MTEIKNGKAVKTFSNRTEYLNEHRAYELLRGTGLAPRLLYSYDGCIERELVDGRLLSDLIRDAKSDLSELFRLFGLFFDWYNAFRKKTGMCLGKVRFESFVLSGEKLVCTDFDCFRKGFTEADLASAVSQLCLKPQAFSAQGMSNARVFMMAARGSLEYDPEILCQKIVPTVKKDCRELKTAFDASKAEYISVYSCMAGLVLAGGKHPLEESTKSVVSAPERFVSVVKGGPQDSSSGFETIVFEGPAADSCGRTAEALRKIKQPWTLVLTTAMPEIPSVLIRTLLCADKEEAEAVMVEAGGRLRDFPVLLRTNDAAYDLELASSKGKHSVADALARRSVKVVRLESLEGRETDK